MKKQFLGRFRKTDPANIMNPENYNRHLEQVEEGDASAQESGYAWFRMMAEQGYANAQFITAMCLRDGIGTEPDGEQALEWLERSAAQGYHEAQFLLGVYHLHGGMDGVEEDEAEGLRLLELAVEAARVRATLGEISYACEKVVGRYKAVIRTISGVYSSETKKDADFQKACELTAEFAKKEGRQPRIMIAKMGQDGHDRGAKVVATGYADCGFDVDMGPLFQTPAEAARDAVENDVHVVGVSSLAAGHKTLVPQIIEELKKLGREDIVVIAGGVIPAQDYDFLYKAGVAAIFGPGTPVAKAACQILEILMDEE